MKTLLNKKMLLVATIAVSANLFLADSLLGQISTLQGDDVDGREVRSIVLEGWELENWDVEAIPGPPSGIATTKLVDGQPRNLQNNSKNKKSLGIRYNFVYAGNNSIILTPPKNKNVRLFTGQLDAQNKPKYIDIPGIQLPGRVEALSVWVLGRGNKAELEAWLQDWKGDTHVFKFGSLDFIGWRPLIIKIPRNVPQNISSFPQTKSLILKRLVVRTNPIFPQEEVVFFMDSLKVLSKVYDLYFDGVDMHYDARDKEYKDKLSKYKKQLLQGNQD